MEIRGEGIVAEVNIRKVSSDSRGGYTLTVHLGETPQDVEAASRLIAMTGKNVQIAIVELPAEQVIGGKGA